MLQDACLASPLFCLPDLHYLLLLGSLSHQQRLCPLPDLPLAYFQELLALAPLTDLNGSIINFYIRCGLHLCSCVWPSRPLFRASHCIYQVKAPDKAFRGRSSCLSYAFRKPFASLDRSHEDTGTEHALLPKRLRPSGAAQLSYNKKGTFACFTINSISL